MRRSTLPEPSARGQLVVCKEYDRRVGVATTPSALAKMLKARDVALREACVDIIKGPFVVPDLPAAPPLARGTPRAAGGAPRAAGLNFVR